MKIPKVRPIGGPSNSLSSFVLVGSPREKKKKLGQHKKVKEDAGPLRTLVPRGAIFKKKKEGLFQEG